MYVWIKLSPNLFSIQMPRVMILQSNLSTSQYIKKTFKNKTIYGMTCRKWYKSSSFSYHGHMGDLGW